MKNFLQTKFGQQKKMVWLAAAALMLLGGLSYGLWAKFAKQATPTEGMQTVNPAFADYVQSYTSGVIIASTPIRVRLNYSQPDTSLVGKEAGKLFSFSPSLSGKAYWVDQQTVEFRPDQRLKNGQDYKVSFKLAKIVPVHDKAFEQFEFSFLVVPLNFEVLTQPLRSDENGDTYTLSGSILFTDEVDPEAVEQLLKLESDLAFATIQWQHQKQESQFSIAGIERGSKSTSLQLLLNGKKLGIGQPQKRDIHIPERSYFGLLSVDLLQESETVVRVVLSDPVDPRQDLRGLVLIDGKEPARSQLDGNYLLLYPGKLATGKHQLSLQAGLRNKAGKKINGLKSIDFGVDDMKPAVRALRSGSILPAEGREVLFPFEAVNLRAVLLEVYEIPAHNISQFLQNNALDGSYSMRQVARPVQVRTIPLNTSGNQRLNTWNRFAINVADHVNINQGSLYQIKIRFNRGMLLNPCKSENGSNEDSDDFERLQSLQESFDEPGYYSYYDDYDEANWDEDDSYDWRKRDDPCNQAYYNGDRYITGNLLVSDLGISAKRGNDGSVQVWVNRLRDSKAVAGAEVLLTDYQGNLLVQSSTNASGLVQFNLNRRPFLCEVRSGKERGYLKLDDGSSLNLSDFDISGTNIQRGLKGFAYGERGVWRPGDSIYLSFMLERSQQPLPEAYPVVMELRNPKGQLVDRQVNVRSVKGVYAFRSFTRADAMTGNYLARFKAGGVHFDRNIRIETIKPNRLKIDFGVADDGQLQAGKETFIPLKVRYLNGAQAGGLRAVYDLVLSPSKTSFKSYPNYVFDDPSAGFTTTETVLFDERLDASGHASVRLKLPANLKAPGVIKANFKGKVFEPGGDFSIDNVTALIYPFSSFAGLRVPYPNQQRYLDIEKSHRFELISVDAKGKPTGSNRMEVQVYKIDWNWWWQSTEEYLSSYMERNAYNTVLRQEVGLINGKGHINLKVDRGWGRYYVRVKDLQSGHSSGTIVYFDESYWAGKRGSAGESGANRLVFQADKEKYQLGETIKLTIPSPGPAMLMLTVENGSGILMTQRHELKAGTNVIELPSTANMSPNVYLFASLVQPYVHPDNEAPMRQYGVVGIEVENPANRIQPVVKVPATLKAQQNFKIEVKESQGRPMVYTVAVVDEGLLGLTRFKTPDPYKHFYAREALGVRTWDMYDQVMGAFGAGIDRLLALGGDQELRPGEEGPGMRFKPVVRYFGPFYLEKGKTAQHNFMLPNYIGELRTMVVAGYEGAYGHAEAATKISNPIMLLSSFPRVLTTNEEVNLPVNVFNLSKTNRAVQVEVKSSNMLTLASSNTQVVNIAAGKSALAYFRFKTGAGEGKQTVEIKASAGEDGYTETIDILLRNPAPMVQTYVDVEIAPGERWQKELVLPGIPGTNQASLELYGLQPVYLEHRLQQLLHYPHGCLEQTLSTAFPQLWLGALRSQDEATRNRIQQNIKSSLAKLGDFQRADGSFSYWPGLNYSNDWVTSYAGHFLVEARRMGYTVPEEAFSRWREYQEQAARQYLPKKETHLVQAYRLYTLALAGHPQVGATNRLRELLDNAAGVPGLMLSLTYALSGQEQLARNMLLQIDLPNPSLPGYDPYSFGSAFRNAALGVLACKQAGLNDKALRSLNQLTVLFNGDEFLSTQESAMYFMAMYACKDMFENSGIQASVRLNKTERFEAEGSEISYHQPLAIGQQKAQLLEIHNRGKQTLYARINLTGKPLYGKEQTQRKQLEMRVSYFNKDGSALDFDKLQQGQQFYAEVQLNHPGNFGQYHQLAMRMVVPAGFEIVNNRLDGTLQLVGGNQAEYVDIRDDRLSAYFDLAPGRTFKQRVELVATYAGKFYLPGVICESMYSDQPYAADKGKWIEILAAP